MQKQLKDANDFLANEMGHMVNRASKERIPIKLSKDEIQTYIKRFQLIDKDKKGYVSINDIRRALKVSALFMNKFLYVLTDNTTLNRALVMVIFPENNCMKS